MPLKIFTSCLRDKIFNFLKANNFIEHSIQKGFIPGLTGAFERTSQMAHLLKKARLKQKAIVITHIDLKNAFGEVHHNLINEVNNFHHIPESISGLIKSLYEDFNTSVITSEFQTPFVKVEKGVLPGDCLSPLLFNKCINTFVQFIKSDSFRQLGFFTNSNFSPRHWFQFADEASTVSGQENENQILLNAFTRWCQWSGMTIRVDKCTSFAMRKKCTQIKQYLPKLYVNNLMIPPVKLNETFTYLGRHYNFDMDESKHKESLSKKLNELLDDTDRLPLHPKNKLKLFRYYVLSKLTWDCTVANLSATWVKENFDNVASRFLRRWLEFPVCGTPDICLLSKEKFGLDVILPSTKFMQCQVTIRNSLIQSPNADIREMHNDTSNGMNLQFDNFNSTKVVLKSIRKDKSKNVTENLRIQGVLLKFLLENTPKNFTLLWTKMQDSLPRNIFSFTVR